MPDDDLDLDDEYDDEETPDPEPEDRPRRNPLREQNKKLNKELRELRKAQAEAQAAVRERAFLKAGIDPDDPHQSFFMKGYEGELDPDAIRAAAVEAKFLEPPEPPPDAAAHAAVGRAAAGAIQPPADTGQPRFVQDPEGYRAALKEARNQEDTLSVAEAWGSPVGSRTYGE